MPTAFDDLIPGQAAPVGFDDLIPQQQDVLAPRSASFMGGVLEGMPVIGPYVKQGADVLGAATETMLGEQTYPAYEAALKRRQQAGAQVQQAHPYLNTAGQIAGGVAGTAPLVAAAPAAFGTGGGGLLARSAASAGSGAALNAADAAVRSGGDLAETGKGAMIGGLLGGAAPGVGQVAGNTMRALTRRIPEAPTMQDIQRAGTALYDRARSAGLAFRPNSFGSAVSDIGTVAHQAGIDPTIHPAATAAMRRLLQAAGSKQPQTLQNIDTLRRVIGGAAGSANRDERRIARLMTQRLDDYLDSLTPQDILAGQGNLQEATQALTQARARWSTLRKSEIIANIFSDAELRAGANYTQAGMETSLRQGFRTLAKKITKGTVRGFNPEEVAAIRRVATGGPIENAARMLGKFAPRGLLSTTLSGGAGFGLAQMLGLPGQVGVAALLAGGELGKRAATSMTTRNARLVDALVRSGGRLPPPPPSPTSDAVQRLTQLLMLGAAPQQAQQSPTVQGFFPSPPALLR